MNTAFERTTQKEEWLTPRFIIEALGPFDLDPCASIVQPWPTARNRYTVEDDGLFKRWDGFIWCNPPYGRKTPKWMRRMAEHDNGIALTFARTETKMFFDSIWNQACGFLFIKGRLSFCDTGGNPAENGAGAPSVLIAYGKEALHRLRCAKDKIPGAFLKGKRNE